MKKFYSMLLFALLTVVGASATTWTFTANVDGVAYAKLDNGSIVPLSTEAVEITVGDYASVTVLAYDGGAITGVSDDFQGAWYTDYNGDFSQGNWNYPYPDRNVSVTAVKFDRSAKFTLNIEGDVEGVKAALTGGGFTNYLSLTPDTHSYELSFDPENEPILYITNSSMTDKYVYSVDCGKYSESRKAEYNVPLSDGCVVNVEQSYPVVTYAVKVSGATDAVAYYTVGRDNTQYPLPGNGTFPTQMDDDITIYFNGGEYKVSSVTVNGETSTFSYTPSNFTFKATENPTTVEIVAGEYPVYNVKININIPEAVRFSCNNEVLNLHNGENDIELKESQYGGAPNLSTSVLGGYEIESFTYVVDDVEAEVQNNYGYYYPTIVQNVTFNVVAKAKEYKHYAIMFGYNVAASQSGTSTAQVYVMDPVTYSGEYFNAKDGYRLVGYNDDNNRFAAYSGAAYENNYLFVNGEPAIFYNYYDLTEQTVIKMGFGEDADSCKVTFDVDPAAMTYIVEDYVLFPDAAEINTFPGTVFQVAGKNIEVFANDEAIEADAEDAKPLVAFPVNLGKDEKIYNITVQESTVISVKVAGGVENVAVDAVEGDTTVYNLQGIKVAEGSLDNLPAGLYIQGGKKVLKK